ncbi:MAG: CHAT domain-containing protein, partial [Candidatus Heimdallarchaeota archaeon]|nr:CHAT domain-containing protein [Candidatus Heimdallarchaeota archaeon]
QLFDQEPQAIIWEFFYDENFNKDQFVILVWTQEGLEAFRSHSIPLDELLEYYQTFHKTLTQASQEERTTALGQELAKKVQGQLLVLSRLLGFCLPEELWSTLDEKTLLLLIPHGQLHLFPWGVAEQPVSYEGTEDELPKGSGHFLGLTVPVVRSYSLGLISSCFQREKLMPKSVLTVANPNFNIPNADLPGAEEEVKTIQNLLQSKGSFLKLLPSLECDQAIKEVFLEQVTVEAPAIIHFAGHGKFGFIGEGEKADPWMSHLAFYGEEAPVHYTVTEMLSKRFPGSPLFILSACETARGKLTKGDEAIGILRGLTLAGATSIIATNWLLADQIAPHFMKEFYNQFLKGETVARALYLARKELVAQGFDHPLYWGVYELYGNPFKRIK